MWPRSSGYCDDTLWRDCQNDNALQCEKAQWLLSGRPLRGGTVATARYLREGAVAVMLDKEAQWLLRGVMKRRTGYCKTVQWQLREHTLERLLE